MSMAAHTSQSNGRQLTQISTAVSAAGLLGTYTISYALCYMTSYNAVNAPDAAGPHSLALISV